LLDNPNGSGQCVTVTLNDEIIGNFFLVATSVTVNGVVKKGYFATDVLTHPEHRDKNLFVKMIRKSITYLKEEKKFIVGHPNKNAIPGWKRTKMEFGPEMSSFISK
ncbi:GNAT family N-acetyltransferase, partial [Vibrio cyclitrophicus]